MCEMYFVKSFYDSVSHSFYEQDPLSLKASIKYLSEMQPCESPLSSVWVNA